MLKNIIIFILGILIVIFWLKDESDGDFDPNDVIIEYSCRDLNDYDTVPEEVLQECRDRGLLQKVDK